MSGYNSAPPPDDGSQTAANQVKWATIKTKLGDPLNVFAAAVNAALVTALDFGSRLVTTNDSPNAADHMKTVEIAPTVTTSVTVTLPDCATVLAGFVISVKNSSNLTQTIDRTTGADTIDGTASSIGIAAGAAKTFKVNTTANGYLTLSGFDPTAYLNSLITAAVSTFARTGVRQTVLSGPLDSSGYAAAISAGAGLNFNVDASPTPVVITYAGGFEASGNTDKVTVLSADQSNQGTLGAANTNYLTSTYLTATTTTWGSTLAPPQYGYAYDRTKQSLLRFAGTDASTTILDDYGNTWTASGNAQIDTAVQIDGLNTLLLDGTGDYITSTNFTTLGSGSWTIECKIRWNTLPSTSAQYFISAFNASSVGVNLWLNNAAGTTRLLADISSNGSTNDIGASVNGTKTTWATGTTYHIAITYDAVAGKYFTYVDGVVDSSTTSSSKVCAITNLRYGANPSAASALNGAMAGCRFLPYCAYPNGTTFTAPTISTFTVVGTTSSDFFSLPDMKLYGVTAASASGATNPTLTAKNVVYVAEQDTNASAVTATRNYAYQGKYVSADTTIPAAGTRTAFSGNLGVIPTSEPILWIRNYLTEDTWSPGMVLRPHTQDTATYNSVTIVGIEDRNTLSFTTGNTAALRKINRTTGVGTLITTANWKMFVTAQRGW